MIEYSHIHDDPALNFNYTTLMTATVNNAVELQ